jgi:hypothetical protein
MGNRRWYSGITPARQLRHRSGSESAKHMARPDAWSSEAAPTVRLRNHQLSTAAGRDSVLRSSARFFP